MRGQKDFHNPCALVLGGYVNGFSIIRELHECGVRSIWLFDYQNSLAKYSNKISGFSLIRRDAKSLKEQLDILRKSYSYIVVYPTDDLQLEMLGALDSEIRDFCFLPFNASVLSRSLNKSLQYEACRALKIPYPKTSVLEIEQDLLLLSSMALPILVKPNKRDDLRISVFRSKLIDSESSLSSALPELAKYIKSGVSFLASEFIPGDDTNIFAYTAYRSKNGVILNEWIGKKLTQYPDNFGVVSSASNSAPEIVREQGRILLDGMRLFGIAEPEFKFDSRDGQFKLMEINLRSMMWHRLGNATGVNLQYTQWLDALNLPPEPQSQELNRRTHFIYMKHELINLLSRAGYWRHFVHNVFKGERREFAILDFSDMRPFIYDLFKFPRPLISRWQKILSKRFG